MKNLFLATVAALAFSGCAGVTGQRAWFIARKKSPVCKAFFSGEPISARSMTNFRRVFSRRDRRKDSRKQQRDRKSVV